MTSITGRVESFVFRFVPDPYIVALLLTLVAFISAWTFTDTGIVSSLELWGDGLWSLLSFTMQMVLILLGGIVVASAPITQKAIRCLVRPANGPVSAILLTTLISAGASLINWGLGLILGAFVAKEIVGKNPNISFAALIASSYTGFLFWHGGLSGSVPLALNTAGNFSAKLVGRTVPLSETIFSQGNLLLIFLLFPIICLTNILITRQKKATTDTQFIYKKIEEDESKRISPPTTFSEKAYRSNWNGIGLGFLLLCFIALKIFESKFQLNLNTINTVLMAGGLLFHQSIGNYLESAKQAASQLSSVIIQYPLYAGLMGLIQGSGLAAVISESLISFATRDSLASINFLTAGLLNFLIPSGGGQWAVQAPIVINSAQGLGADLAVNAMAIAWGDAWTNLAQPFWALPLLAISGLKVKDILPHCLLVMGVSGSVLITYFYFWSL